MADATINRIVREFENVNDSIVQENTIRTLILHAENRNMDILMFTRLDAKIAGLRAQALYLKNVIVNLGEPDPGPINAHIEDHVEEEEEPIEIQVDEHISDRDQFKRDKVCIQCGVDTDKQCSVCKQVRYCGAECWREDREIHKLECKKI